MRRNETGRERWGVGLVLACALGCGGKTASDEELARPPLATPPAFSPRPSPAPPPAPGVSRPQMPVAAPPRVPPPPTVPEPTDEMVEELAQAQVENILSVYCGACHGSYLGTEALGGVGFIDDLDEVVERGYITILNSPSSRIIQVIENGSMPPRGSAAGSVPSADLEIIRRYIDNPRFWPYAPRYPRPLDLDPPAVTLDAGVDAG